LPIDVFLLIQSNTQQGGDLTAGFALPDIKYRVTFPWVGVVFNYKHKKVTIYEHSREVMG